MVFVYNVFVEFGFFIICFYYFKVIVGLLFVFDVVVVVFVFGGYVGCCNLYFFVLSGLLS